MEGEWYVNVLLFADDAVLVAESGEKLRILVREFEGKCTNMSPWLFNLLMDGVVREMEREGKGIRLRNMEVEWDVNILLFADEAVLVVKSGEKLRMLVREFEGKYTNMRLKVNLAKSKVMRIGDGDEEM